MSDATAECSRAGCRDTAAWAILWRNPRIHTPDRRKTWVACDAHVGYLREFLAARDFPLEVRSLSSDTNAAPAGTAPSPAGTVS
ncbi:hypothetical protein ACFWZW_07325 [Microbacterium enclense]|uniref:hypothetical protein n=1 Tax=Microbacterium enclense TaxID=993073 RepID=UPI0036DA6FC4